MLLNGGVHIGTNNSEHLTISSSGKVGIGTTSPQNTLSVAGTVQAYEVLVNTGWSDYIFAPNHNLVRDFTRARVHQQGQTTSGENVTQQLCGAVSKPC